jgi:CRP-like cAMP-binding protein
MNQWHDYLSKADLFFGLNAPERETILFNAREIELTRKDLLCQCNSPATHLFVIVRGALKTVANGNGDHCLLVDFIKAGEILGEENVLLPGNNDVSAVPLDVSLALALPLDNVRKVVDTQPRLGRALAALSAARARAFRERLFLMTTASVPSRLAFSIHGLARRFGKRDKKGTLIPLRITHQDLADHVGASRETVSLFISRFRKQGLVAMNVRRIVVPDLKALKRAADVR